ncbi:MAG: hypothetical protein K0S78_4497, partial [Thermomicrobiales bacterium]|nr:hypothetical protein [Thermomicrobiales bacterium]
MDPPEASGCCNPGNSGMPGDGLDRGQVREECASGLEKVVVDGGGISGRGVS